MPWRDVFILSTCRLDKKNPQNHDHGNSGNGNHKEDGGDEVEDDNDEAHDEDNGFGGEGRRHWHLVEKTMVVVRGPITSTHLEGNFI